MDDVFERVIRFEVFRCGDVEEATSQDGFVYRLERTTPGEQQDTPRYYVCEKAPRCPARVLVCQDGRGILMERHVQHDELEQEEEGVNPEDGPAKDDENGAAEVGDEETFDDNNDSKGVKGAVVLKISFFDDYIHRQTRNFCMESPPTLKELVEELAQENVARIESQIVARAAVFDWILTSEEQEPLDPEEQVKNWGKYEIMFFCDNRILDKSFFVKGSTLKGTAVLKLAIEGSPLPFDDISSTKIMAFDLNSPLNLYEKLQTCFDKSFLHSKYITSDVVEGLIFKFSPSKGEFCEIDEEEEYFEHGSTYKFVYYNSGAPPTAYIVYERVRTMDYATTELNSAIVDTNNYVQRIVDAFCDDPRPSTIVELRMICPDRCTGEKREWRCFACRKMVYFDGDRRLYCSCGGWNAASTCFKCSSHLHEEGFTTFENLSDLKTLANSTPGSDGFSPSAPQRRTEQPTHPRRRASDRTRRSSSNGSVLRGISRLASSISREVRDALKL